MSKQEKKQVYVRVKAGFGNRFLCSLDALKDSRKETDQDLDELVWRMGWPNAMGVKSQSLGQ